MIAYIIYIIIETHLAIRDPEQTAVILFNLTNLWGFFMALKGYLRLRKINNESANSRGNKETNKK